jgi:ATP synthase protein I
MDSDKSPKTNHRKRRAGFIRQVAAKEIHKLRARQEKNQSLWFGLGLLGLVGWSIVVPTLLGLALGAWIDRRFPSHFSWTLMLMVAGLGLGCLNAWKWVDREQAKMTRPPLPKTFNEESSDE